MLRSRYLVMFKKCLNPQCCTPYRSPILKRLPNGFLPSPRVFKYNQAGDLELANPEDVDSTVKYATLSNILSQPIQQDIPFDTFNRKVGNNETVCPFCKLSLCSKAELRRHRVAMHRGMRASGREEFKINMLEEVDGIREIIDQNGDEYLCVMEDGKEQEWRKVPPTHPLIKKFLMERRRLLRNVNDAPVEIPHDELGEFMSSVFENIS